MHRLILMLCLVFAATSQPGSMVVLAESLAPSRQLAEVLRVPEVMQVLREEGLATADEIASDFPVGGSVFAWRREIDRIYDVQLMEDGFTAALIDEVADQPALATEAMAFYGSDLGARVVLLEIEARSAMIDPEVEAQAGAAYDALAGDDPARLALIERFVKVNDLIERNVAGALNANLAFLRGLAEEDGETFALSEGDMLDQVRAGEAEARKDTEAWLFPYLTLTFQPLSDAELQAYVAFSQTEAGRMVNAAMFAAADRMFSAISHSMGRAVARQMTGQDI